jgi:hypothetical protein
MPWLKLSSRASIKAMFSSRKPVSTAVSAGASVIGPTVAAAAFV